MSTLISTPVNGALLRGALETETTERGLLPHRLPAWARAQAPEERILMSESQPSGVRLVFDTEASVLELDTVPAKQVYPGAPPRPDGVYDLLVDGRFAAAGTVPDGDRLTIDLATGSSERTRGPAGTVRFTELPRGPKRVELWLPHNEITELIELRTDAPVGPVSEDDRPLWLHHGSSISHGSNAASPSTTWPALAARTAGVALTNLGFGGSALLDPFIARTMRDTEARLLSLKLGINVVNADLMRLRAFTPAVHGFLDTIREGHPDAPLLLISPIHCPIHEETPGPGAFDTESLRAGQLRFRATGDPAATAEGKLTLRVVREELAKIVAQRAEHDPNLYYLDGQALYGPDDYAELPLPDELHPDAATHERIGTRFAKLVFTGEGPFAQ